MESQFVDVMIWAGILFCLSQSAMFSGLNLALLSISRLRLEVLATTGNKDAQKILTLRQDFNFLLTTILWGNVAINVLLTLLSNSVMAGMLAFFFSTFVITFFGEITPQAYFSRHAMRMGSMLAPVLRFYQFLLYPFAKPCALILDWWLGKEGINYFRESDLREVINRHIEAVDSEVDMLEGVGALNFLALDDSSVVDVGEVVDADSIIRLPFENEKPLFPVFERSVKDPFLQKLNQSGKKWIIILNMENRPQMVMNANEFLRVALFGDGQIDPADYCHKPVLATELNVLLGKVLSELTRNSISQSGSVIKNDLILIWSGQKRVITGSDILGRLLKGVVHPAGFDGNFKANIKL
tara:strand:- start:27644 stop:28705 length:1062 start_codon:yes stop_codon:yes gene_type:complete